MDEFKDKCVYLTTIILIVDMPNPYFRFKKFIIYQDRCAMKVGTDGVLLGAWTDVSSSEKVLDIGTGTGLISLMIAQRCENAHITAIDIDREAITQAKENILVSPWKERIKLLQIGMEAYRPDGLFDTLVSNPPYFVNSLKCQNGKRSAARHTDSLPVSVLLSRGAGMLCSSGRFSLIFPYGQVEDMMKMANDYGLYLSRHTKVITRFGGIPKRSLLEFRKIKGQCVEDELVIELERHVYTEEYISLTKDFYLEM